MASGDPFNKFKENVRLIKRFRTGHCYLAADLDPDEAYDLVKRFLDMGLEGLVVTRDPPQALERRGVAAAKRIWLSNISSDETISGTDLETLSREIGQYAKSASNGFIYVDGFEYLSTHNDFNVLMKLVNTLKDLVSMNQCFLICVLSSEAFEVRQLKMIQREFEPLPGPMDPARRTREFD